MVLFTSLNQRWWLRLFLLSPLCVGCLCCCCCYYCCWWWFSPVHSVCSPTECLLYEFAQIDFLVCNFCFNFDLTVRISQQRLPPHICRSFTCSFVCSFARPPTYAQPLCTNAKCECVSAKMLFFIFSHFCFELFMCALSNRFPYSIRFPVSNCIKKHIQPLILLLYCCIPFFFLLFLLLLNVFYFRYLHLSLLYWYMGLPFFPLLIFIIHSSFNLKIYLQTL